MTILTIDGNINYLNLLKTELLKNKGN